MNEITGIKIRLMQDAAKRAAERKHDTGYAVADRVWVKYYPRSQRFAYFLDGRCVNRSDIEKGW